MVHEGEVSNNPILLTQLTKPKEVESPVMGYSRGPPQSTKPTLVRKGIVGIHAKKQPCVFWGNQQKSREGATPLLT